MDSNSSEARVIMPAIIKGYDHLNNSAFVEWVIKACKNDDKPPKSKHVRRIINGMLRDSNVSMQMMVNIIIDDNHWQTNPILGAKLLYVALSVFQMMKKLEAADDALKKIDMLSSYYEKQRFDEKLTPYWNIALGLASIYHSKVIFHHQNPNVQPNFHSIDGKFPSEFFEILRGYLTKVIYESNRALANIADNFPCTVMVQPFIEEAINSYRLLKFVDKDNAAKTTLRDAEALFEKAQSIQFLRSAVIYPPKYNSIPEPRFSSYGAQ
ncbi:hypothetical protein TVAG_044140 [Trichomonas vaginalis G3]|uniref:Uncharacterized protein n=1 Tax=Trichomonas vaginalis (strain ATCC PRA-98 / G3) TaxID=412133 RepID=A2E0H4_TRIV3|nr:clathrin-coated pit assembly [Trichomonas vaginalis G3]EAY13854.1 hypothetical protein TVAG_044140 [Trichomonas vaginalis G3]KAI5519861.1 clathrin-coated pit assembly [Trichomonas vaginalis G3]|eukprot:XP_001326077.1 hypothetical protein [Trichomonas vaginalis G3]